MRLFVHLNAHGQRHFVGILENTGHKILFEYAPDFLKTDFQLSPFHLPLRRGAMEETKRTFDGLFGLFNDSLPDGWGLLLLDRALQKKGIRLEDSIPLQRLAMTGANGMGALEYTPESPCNGMTKDIDLDALASDALSILCDEPMPTDRLDELISLNGSSAGARPKILVNVSDDKETLSTTTGEAWLIKFRSQNDPSDAGLEEYIYSQIARNAGLEMPMTHLFPSDICSGYFGVQRFDRMGPVKIHTHTACGLLHASHREPSLSYESLLKMTQVLTKDMQEVLKMARLMVFNVKIGNRDDHSKNFSYLMDAQGQWHMAPAYDLTPAQGFNDEHTTMVNGKGKNITNEDLIQAATLAGIPVQKMRDIIEDVDAAVADIDHVRTRVLNNLENNGPRP